MAALEGRKEASMPIRAGIFFEMFPFCLLFEKDMIIKNMGGALRNCIPQMVGKKVISPFEISQYDDDHIFKGDRILGADQTLGGFQV